MKPFLPLLLLLPLLILSLYVFRVALKYPHVRRMAFRESVAGKATALLTILGLAVGTSMITIVASIEFMLASGTESQLRQHFGPIEYEVPAIWQPEPTRYYYLQTEIDRMRQSMGEPGDLLPIVSYTVSGAPAADSEGERTIPNLLVIGLDPAKAAFWTSEEQRAEWLDVLPFDGMILSAAVANRMGVRSGDFVEVFDLQNRKHRFQVAEVLQEDGLTGYRGIQNAAATAIVGLERARALFDLPRDSYTTVLGKGQPPKGTWQTAPVRAEAAGRLYEGARTASNAFFFISLNAVVMGIILMFNLFKMISEERRLGLGILHTIGFSRVDLKRIMRVEGLIYAAAACLPGTAAGLVLSGWLMDRINLLYEGELRLAGRLDFATSIQAAATGGSMALAFAAACIWLVSGRTFSASRIRARSPGMDETSGHRRENAVSIHALISGIILVAMLGFVTVTLFPQVRQEWFNQADILVLPIAIFLMTPLLSYAGIRWLEGIWRLILPMLRRLPRAYAMLHLALKQMVAERVRNGLSIMLFCAVTGFVSFAVVMSGYLQFVVGQTDPRDGIGGYDYYAEDIRMIDSKQLGDKLLSVGYPQGEAPVSAALVQLPWSESGSFDYMVNGVDEAYAATTRIPVSEAGGGKTAGTDLWRELAESPDGMIVSTGALDFLFQAKWAQTGDRIDFSVNGHKVSKKIIGVVEENTAYYPFMKGIWMNAEETRRIGQGFKTMHSALFVRFPAPEIADKWQRRTESVLAASNIFPLNGVDDMETGYYGQVRMLLRLFEQFNLLAMAIGIAGLALVILRSAKRRRHQLGALRALGIPPGWLLSYIWIEGSVTGIFGTCLGFASGGYISYMVCRSQVQEVTAIAGFGFPAVQALLLLGVVILLVAAGTLASAWSVYRISPVQSAKHLIS